VNDAAQGVVEDVPQDVAQDLGFRARAARALLAMPPLPPPPPLCSSRLDGSATGQLSGIWLGLWASASEGAAQSAFMFIVGKTERRRPVKGSRREPDADEDRDEGVGKGG